MDLSPRDLESDLLQLIRKHSGRGVLVDGKLDKGRLHGFRSLLAHDVRILRECECQAREAVNSEAFPKFGLTDAVIHTMAQNDVLVLTDDFPLAGFLEHHGIDVVNFNRLRPLVWQ